MTKAVGRGSKNAGNKVNFGKRKKGSASKTFNKHDRTEKNYRGQGR